MCVTLSFKRMAFKEAEIEAAEVAEVAEKDSVDDDDVEDPSTHLLTKLSLKTMDCARLKTADEFERRGKILNAAKW